MILYRYYTMVYYVRHNIKYCNIYTHIKIIIRITQQTFLKVSLLLSRKSSYYPINKLPFPIATCLLPHISAIKQKCDRKSYSAEYSRQQFRG